MKHYCVHENFYLCVVIWPCCFHIREDKMWLEREWIRGKQLIGWSKHWEQAGLMRLMQGRCVGKHANNQQKPREQQNQTSL